MVIRNKAVLLLGVSLVAQTTVPYIDVRDVFEELDERFEDLHRAMDGVFHDFWSHHRAATKEQEEERKKRREEREQRLAELRKRREAREKERAERMVGLETELTDTQVRVLLSLPRAITKENNKVDLQGEGESLKGTITAGGHQITFGVSKGLAFDLAYQYSAKSEEGDDKKELGDAYFSAVSQNHIITLPTPVARLEDTQARFVGERKLELLLPRAKAETKMKRIEVKG